MDSQLDDWAGFGAAAASPTLTPLEAPAALSVFEDLLVGV